MTPRSESPVELTPPCSHHCDCARATGMMPSTWTSQILARRAPTAAMTRHREDVAAGDDAELQFA